jgi:transposase
MAGFEAELQRAADNLREAQERRDSMILRATEAGMSRRAVASAVGLSVGRVQQIVEARRQEA